MIRYLTRLELARLHSRQSHLERSATFWPLNIKPNPPLQIRKFSLKTSPCASIYLRNPRTIASTPVSPKYFSQQIRHYTNPKRDRSMADTSGSITISKQREVLPTNVVPRHYDLTLEPNFENFTFDGSGELQSVFLGLRGVNDTQLLLTSMSPTIRLPSP